MKGSIRTQDRTAERSRRRRPKEPSPETLLRIEWLTWLVEQHGADVVADWDEPPTSFEAWMRDRALKAHEAA
jgi:hypothetical protein